MQQAMTDWIGNTLGKVRIELLLARGGMAEVYIGTHTTLQRAVAIKLLRNQYLDDPDLLERFQREARVVASLRHPNIVQVFDFDIFNGQPYLVMEFVPGVSLSTYLRALHERDQYLELPQVSQLLTKTADALQYAHESGVIHRDVKPGNILLTSRVFPIDKNLPLPADVEPVLSDFGLVRYLTSPSQTATGQIAGTPAYMSPEQARGDRADGRSDIYSLGIVLYEILAGRVPFEADTTMGVLLKHINEPPEPIPGLAPQLQEVIDCALAKKPEDRYQTPRELSQAFETALQERTESPTLIPSASGPTLKPVPASKRTRPLMWIGAGLVFLLVAGILFMKSIPPPVAAATPTATAANSPIATTPPTITETTVAPAQEAEDVGLLHFLDVAAHVDGITVSAKGMPSAPEGKQYEVWLVSTDDETRRSLGVLTLDADGSGVIEFVDEQSRNMLSRYDRMEITFEPMPDSSPNPSNEVAFSSSIPRDSLIHVRHLLVSMPDTPNQIGLILGLWNNSNLIDEYANTMLTSYEAGDEAAARKNAEAVMNMIVGAQSDQYGDLDKDGDVTDPGDGFGILLNGDSSGYAGGVYSHAGYAMMTGDAPASVIIHGEHVQISVENVEGWSVELRDLALSILDSPFDETMRGKIVQAVGLADQIVNGVDLNGNERVDPIPGEGGVETAYQHAYYMADLVILPGQGRVPPPAPTPSSAATPSAPENYNGG